MNRYNIISPADVGARDFKGLKQTPQPADAMDAIHDLREDVALYEWARLNKAPVIGLINPQRLAYIEANADKLSTVFADHLDDARACVVR